MADAAQVAGGMTRSFGLLFPPDSRVSSPSYTCRVLPASRFRDLSTLPSASLGGSPARRLPPLYCPQVQTLGSLVDDREKVFLVSIPGAKK